MRLAFAAAILVTCANAQTFEVASVKLRSPDQKYLLKRECANDRFIASGMPLQWHITWSYKLRDSQVIGLPDWTKDFASAYNFDARAAGSIDEDQCRAMVRSLVADRFKMTSHIEQRELPVYDLVVAKGTVKMREVTEATTDSTGVGVNGAHEADEHRRLLYKGWPMSRLAIVLSDLPEVGRIVVDKTGLTGLYSFELAYSRKPDDGKPSVFTAVEEQLGLKLQASKAKLDVLIVDHIEKAGAN